MILEYFVLVSKWIVYLYKGKKNFGGIKIWLFEK